MARDYRLTPGDSQKLQTYCRRWSEIKYILQKMDRDCKLTTRDGQRLGTYQRKWSKTADLLQEMVRGCMLNTRDVRNHRLNTLDVRHRRLTTRNGQRLPTYYRRWSEPADILPGDDQRLQTYCQEIVRDSKHNTGDIGDWRLTTRDGQKVQTNYRRWSEAAELLK